MNHLARQFPEHDSFLNRMILHVQRTRKPSTISSQNLNTSGNNNNNNKSVITVHSYSDHKDVFSNRHVHLGEMEADCCNNSCAHHFHYFHLYLNLTYALLIVPYCPVRQNGHYKLTTNKLQRILCMISCALVVFRQLSLIRATWLRTFYHPIIFYFYLAHVHFHGILTILFYWTFHAKLNLMEGLLEKISCCCLLAPSANKRSKAWMVIIFLHILFPLMGILSPAVGHDVIDSWSWTPSWLFRSYIPRAQFAFFFNTDINLSTIRPEWGNITKTDIMWTSFYIMIIMLHEVHMYLMSLLFGLCTLTLWTATNAFQKSIELVNLTDTLRRDRKHAQATLLYLFYELKGLSIAMNKVFGLFSFVYIIDIIPYLATDLDFGLRAFDWFDALKMSRSVFFFAWNIIISAETYRKIQWFLSWLLERENRDLFANNMEDLTLLLEELRTEPVGLGASGFFHVNYGFGAQICTIIITFFIITLQYADLHPKAGSSWWT